MNKTLILAAPITLLVAGLVTAHATASGSEPNTPTARASASAHATDNAHASTSAQGSGSAHGSGAARSREIVQIEDARLKFEINHTDGDGGVQVFLDAEQWRRMSIFDPQGHRIFTSVTKGRMGRQGGTELFMESAEPTFKDLPLRALLRRFPAGRYEFRGKGLEGETYVGAARLTHHIPAAPTLVSPTEDGPPQDPDATVVRWRRVPAPAGSSIIGYQVLVENPETGLRAMPVQTLDVTMPPAANHLAVPEGYLAPDTEYDWEVLAIEASGNQTIASSSFTTAD